MGKMGMGMDVKRLHNDMAYQEAHIKTILEAVEKQNGAIKPRLKQEVIMCMKNAINENNDGRSGRNYGVINEDTTSSNISFLGVQLPVISAILPSLVLDEVAVVQALDRRVGSVFLLDVLRGTTKGGDDVAGSTLINAQTGHSSLASARQYATTNVFNESLGAKSSANVFSKQLTSTPVVSGTTVVTVSDASAVEDTLVVSSSNGTTDTLTGATLTGSVVLASGVVTINGDGSSVTAAATYRYNFQDTTTPGVPQLDINMRQLPITAEDFMVKTKFSTVAAVDLEKAHGINLEELLIEYLGGELKFNMDHTGIDMIVNGSKGIGSATTPGTFTATVGDGQEWVFKKYQFMDYVRKASNNIFAATKRAKANFIIAGLDAARIIAQMSGDDFKEIEVEKPTGPYKMGTLKGVGTVIVDPFIDASTITFGWRGSKFLEAGFIFAPYIPLFSTPGITLADLTTQKAFYSAAGYLLTNPAMYNSGTVVGLTY